MKHGELPALPGMAGRCLDYDEFQAAKKAAAAGVKAELGLRRGIRRPRRDPMEWESLMRLDEPWLATGAWTFISSRCIEIRLD